MVEVNANQHHAGLRGRTVVFIFDYVMHYHRETIQRLAKHVSENGGRFVLLSGYRPEVTSGRKPLAEDVVSEQYRYRLYERVVGTFTIRYQQGVIRRLWDIRPDVVVTVCHSGTVTEWLVGVAKKLLGFRMVAWQCGYEYNPGALKTTILSVFVRFFDHHLAYHSNAKRYALTYGATAKQVTVMHNTVNEASIVCLSKDEARRTLVQKYPTLDQKIVVLYVGAVLQEKRLEVIVDALSLLNDSRLAFVVVGDGPHLESLQRYSAGRDDVIFAGRVVEGVGVFFDGSDMLVLPGTGGLVLNEAMAHSLPLISGYADGSADDLVVSDLNGFRLDSERAQDWADRIKVLGDSHEMRARMGCESRRMICNEFSFENFISRATQVLDTV